MSSRDAYLWCVALALCSALSGCSEKRSQPSGAPVASATPTASVRASAAAPASTALDIASFPPLTGVLPASAPDPLARPQVRFSPDGRRLLVCCSRGAPGNVWWIHVWDLEHGKLAGAIAHKDDGGGDAAAPFVGWSPQGRYVVVHDSHRLRVFRADTLRQHNEAPADYGTYAIDVRDLRLVWGRSNADMFLVDLTSGKSLAKHVTGGGATGLMVDLDWSPEGGHVLADGLIWQRDGAPEVSWEKAVGRPWPNDEPVGWTWTADGKTLLMAAGGRLSALDVRSGRVLWSAEGVEPPIALHPGGELLAFIAPSGSVGLLNLSTHQPVASFTDTPREADMPREPVRFGDDAIRFSADGARFAVQRTFARLRICEVTERACLRLPFGTERNAAAPRWRGVELYVHASSAFVSWSPRAARRWRLDFPGDGIRTGFDVSEDGRYVAVATPGAAVVVRLADRRVVALTAAFAGGAWGGSLAPDDAEALRGGSPIDSGPPR